MTEALQETSGPSLLDILRSKQSGSLRNAAVRDHNVLPQPHQSSSHN